MKMQTIVTEIFLQCLVTKLIWTSRWRYAIAKYIQKLNIRELRYKVGKLTENYEEIWILRHCDLDLQFQ